MSDLALLDCPFCGGRAELEEVDGGWSVGCEEKAASVHYCMGYQSLTSFATKREAVVAWNTRTFTAAERSPGEGSNFDKALNRLTKEAIVEAQHDIAQALDKQYGEGSGNDALAEEPKDFVQRLIGRAAFCRDRGEIKTPELLEQAAAALRRPVIDDADEVRDEFIRGSRSSGGSGNYALADRVEEHVGSVCYSGLTELLTEVVAALRQPIDDAMVERVAEVLAFKLFDTITDWRDDVGKPFRDRDTISQNAYRHAARAALEAAREVA